MTVTGTGNLGSIRGVSQAAGVPNTTTECSLHPDCQRDPALVRLRRAEEIYYA
jgi:hypothetical protein